MLINTYDNKLTINYKKYVIYKIIFKKNQISMILIIKQIFINELKSAFPFEISEN